jgi:hypothetical protein
MKSKELRNVLNEPKFMKIHKVITLKAIEFFSGIILPIDCKIENHSAV